MDVVAFFKANPCRRHWKSQVKKLSMMERCFPKPLPCSLYFLYLGNDSILPKGFADFGLSIRCSIGIKWVWSWPSDTPWTFDVTYGAYQGKALLRILENLPRFGLRKAK